MKTAAARPRLRKRYRIHKAHLPTASSPRPRLGLNLRRWGRIPRRTPRQVIRDPAVAMRLATTRYYAGFNNALQSLDLLRSPMSLPTVFRRPRTVRSPAPSPLSGLVAAAAAGTIPPHRALSGFHALQALRGLQAYAAPAGPTSMLIAMPTPPPTQRVERTAPARAYASGHASQAPQAADSPASRSSHSSASGPHTSGSYTYGSRTSGSYASGSHTSGSYTSASHTAHATPLANSPTYQPPSHPASPTPLPRPPKRQRSPPAPLHPRLPATQPAQPRYTEPPSPVEGITRPRPSWTRPGGPLPPFVRAVPPDFEEHRWNMAYVVHEVGGLAWHPECGCVDCDEGAYRRVTRLPKFYPGHEAPQMWVVARK